MQRRTTILAPSDLGASGTKVIDIDEKSVISRITVIFGITIATVSVMLNTLRSTVSKLELVDGGRVLFSVGGDALAGINFFETGKLPTTELTLTATQIAYARLDINFGRYPGDPEYAFRPEYFTNPQLRITFDEDACNTSAVANVFAVYGEVVDNPPGGGPSAMLITRSVQSYAMAASAHEYVNLFTDYPVRALFIRGKSTDHDTPTLFDHVKIDLNNGNPVLIDHDYTDLLRMAGDLGPVSIDAVLDDAVTAKDLYVPTMYRNKLNIAYDDTAHVTAQTKFAEAAYKGPFIDVAASVDIKAVTGTVVGQMPGGVLPISFGNPMEPDSWLRPSPADSFRADITASADADSGDDAEVLIQQEMRY